MNFPYPPAFEKKIIAPQRLPETLADFPKPLVFTNGCFDILHRGHATYLAQAKTLGQTLLVALNSDASVRRQNKGAERPLNCLENRLALVAALASVDCVTWFEEDTPAALIETVRPEILVKGGDWPPEKIVGAKETLARGGQVYSIAFMHQTSTTALVQQILGSAR